MNKTKIYLVIIIFFLSQSCEKKIFTENMDSFMFHLKDNIYLDHPTRSILVKNKRSEDSFTIEKVIIDKIDSIYINNDKTIIYIINDKNECIWVKPNFKTEKLTNKPNVIFKSIMSYHN